MFAPICFQFKKRSTETLCICHSGQKGDGGFAGIPGVQGFRGDSGFPGSKGMAGIRGRTA